jgi:bifunctional DNA-binding transcriptional regulator/antitoxin component of YhaV-PrlF toxin-antitoxin module
VLPKQVREAHHWATGQELAVIDLPDCVILKKAPLAETAWADVVGRLAKYRRDKPVTDEEMHAAVLQGAAASYQQSLETTSTRKPQWTNTH